MDTDFHSEISVSLWYDILCFFVLFTVYVFSVGLYYSVAACWRNKGELLVAYVNLVFLYSIRCLLMTNSMYRPYNALL